MTKNCLGYSVVERKLFPQQDKVDKLLKDMGLDAPIEVDESEIVKVDGEFEILPSTFSSYDEMMVSFAKEYEEEIKLLKKMQFRFAKNGLPKYPKKEDIVVKPGWAMYDFNGIYIEQVESPPDEILVFDVETFVQGGNFPIIGTATGIKNSYIWIAKEFIEEVSEEDFDQYDFVPLPNTKVIVGHNVGFDLCRVREAYELPSKITAFDTLSAHVATNGLCSAQRYVASLRYKDKEKLTEREKAILRHPPKWAEAGTTNSLVAVYNFHVARGDFFEEVEEISEADKEIRSVFVDTPTMRDFQNMGLFQKDLLFYAAKDTYYTGRIFEKLFPKYLVAKPHVAALAGHLEIMNARVPISDDWNEWIERVEKILAEDQKTVSSLIVDRAKELYEKWANGELSLETIKLDPWLSQLNWQIKRKKCAEVSRRNKVSNILELLPPDSTEAEIIKACPQLLNEAGNLIPEDAKKRAKLLFEANKYVFVPAWFMPIYNETCKISTKSDLCHLLMGLKWKGKPIYKHKLNGWGTYNEDGKFEKVPHKESVGENVGDLLAKGFLDDIKNGNLTGEHEGVSKVFDIAIKTSFWISTRNRVIERFVKRSKIGSTEGNLMCPQTIVHGTTTGRATENLLLVMSNIKPDKIGSELRSKIEAPKGYKIVG